MDRRKFLKTTGGLMAGATLGGNRLAEALSQSDTRAATAVGRMLLPINRNWRYSATAVEGFAARDFDDSGFERVVIPHSNQRLPWHSFDEKSYQFISAYRRHFRLPQAMQGHHVFADFEGVMTAATVWINGQQLGEYRGGYTPFSFELTPHLDWQGDNVLAVAVDSRERPDIPPFGGQMDYLTFGGIYREVALRLVPGIFLENIFAMPVEVLGEHPAVHVRCFVSVLENSREPLSLEAELRDGGQVLARAEGELTNLQAGAEPAAHTLELRNLGPIQLWDLNRPKLYTVTARLRRGPQIVDEDTRRIGMREARFTDEGFKLNGRVLKLRGLNRHQTFPFVGPAMPARVQKQDALILKKELKCNMVRTSHYPQSRHFLDACDEIGLLVFEEIPGWQHIGDEQWKQLAIDNVGRMVRRDWNHPSIILWGVRINESRDDHDFYIRTNALAHSLDPIRQTGGVRDFQESEFLEDVFTMNDFGFPLKPPNHPRYLNTEFVGHTCPTKSIDNVGRLTEHTLRHTRVHNQIGSSAQYSGGLGWCAFDYNTHADFGSGDRVCYHGVCDIFRLPKPAAGFYKSQCDPREEIVLEPAFHWSEGDEFRWRKRVLVCSNCDHLKLYVGGTLLAEVDPDRTRFGSLAHPPFLLDASGLDLTWSDLRIEGYLAGGKVIEKSYSGKGVDQKFEVLADASTLLADGADTTRVVFRVTDEFGAVRPYATGAIAFTLEGPADFIGDNPFPLFGGVGAIWVRARETPGPVLLRAKHPYLGVREVPLRIQPAATESV